MSLSSDLKSYQSAKDDRDFVSQWLTDFGSLITKEGISISILTDQSNAPDALNDLVKRYIIDNRVSVIAYINSELDSDVTSLESSLLIDLQSKIDEINTP